MKQVFEANTKLRRVICAVLVAIMVIGMIPLSAPKAVAASGTTKLFFEPNSNWKSSGAWFAAWVWGGNNSSQWVTMKDSNNDGIYVADIPAGITSVKIYRMSDTASTPDHNNNVWNTTTDIQLNNNNYLKINSNGNGWDDQTCTGSKFTCDHAGHSQSGVCKKCDTTSDDVHNYVNGSCSCGASTCSHPSHNQSGKCTSCGASVGHSFSAATCTVAKTCSVCHVTEGNALGHNYENGSCSRCGAADPNYTTTYYLTGYINASDKAVDYKNYPIVPGVPVTYSFNSNTYLWISNGKSSTSNKLWKTDNLVDFGTTTGTFTTNGSNKIRIPLNVEITFTLTENFDANGNLVSLTLSYTSCTHANHTQDLVCSDCGKTLSSHPYKAYRTEPTCSEDGFIEYRCSCGLIGETETIASTGHTYVDTVIAPTCTAAGYTLSACTKCGNSTVKEGSEVAATGHTYIKVVTAPTCTEEGYTTYTCKCGHSYIDKEKVAPLGHQYVNGYCSGCGAKDPNAGSVSGHGGVVYYDASLSKMLGRQNVDGDNHSNSMPIANGVMYCHYWKEGSNGTTVKMTLEERTIGNHTFKYVWKANIASNATHVIFFTNYDNNSAIPGTCSRKTGNLKIPTNIKNPCFYGDPNETAMYNNTVRDGYWGSAYQVRSAELMKGTDIVDIENGSFNTQRDLTMYVNTTFFDYYSDYELAGRNLDDRSNDWARDSYRNWYIFRNFNTALSAYYDTNKAKVPVYMGHFQPDGWGTQYWDLNQVVPLYGYRDGKAYGTTTDDQKYFMSVNNSNFSLNGDGKYDYAAWGIVGDTLSNNNLLAPIKQGDNNVLHPLFNERFINGENILNTQLGEVYHNVKFPFKQQVDEHGIAYWVFDSSKTTLEMKKDGSTYFLDEVTYTGSHENVNASSAGQGTKGFFPFNEGANHRDAKQYNYGFGTRIDLNFNLTEDGMLANATGDKYPIVFEFSGDDDVWVFIDGNLVLDIGGSHGRVDGTINFAELVATVNKVKSSGGDHDPKDKDGNSVRENVKTSFSLKGQRNGEHTLTMFYMERGMWESNMKISFSFIPDAALLPSTTSLKLTKQWNVTDVNKIPADIYVQLQRRPVGSGTWNAVDGYESVRLTKVGNTDATKWLYEFNDLPKYANDVTKLEYEYRVVELMGNNGAVLSAGELGPNGMQVFYGEVSGSQATGLNQIVLNNQADNKQVVVIDYGISVDITAVTAAGAEVIGVGSPLKVSVGQSETLDPDISDSYTSAYGVATVRDNKIRYTPSHMRMDAADIISFAYTQGDGKYHYSTVTVIPAANIYYEDNFLSFKNSPNATVQFGRWGIDGSTSNNVQAEDRPGALNANDADNVYGYDQAYDNFTLYSLGSARKVTVNAATGKPSTAPTASFSFTGTGFDVVSLTDNTSGAISVEVKKGNALVLRYVVNNFYGMIYENGSWRVDRTGKENALYQVPVIKVEDLEYGTYDVTIKAAYMDIMDKTTPDGYTIWVDAIRIYNPALNDKTSNDAYLADGESNPHLTTLKKLLVDPGFDAYYDVNADVEINGVVFVEGKDDVVSMAEYANQGPNNETYLKNGNSVVFKFRIKDVVDPDVGPQIGLQIGAKLAIGDEATLKVALNNSSEATTVVTTRTATNMFYKLPQITWEEVDGGWESCPIMFKCEAAEAEEDEEDNILSLTDLKLTGPDADFATYVNVSDEDNTEEANIQTFVDYECYSYAVNVMSAPVVNPVTLTGNSFSLSFEDEILVNYYYAISDVTNVTEHGMLVFNTDPGAADIAKADQKYDAPVYVESENLYACTTSGIAAKEMGDSRYYCAYAKLSDGTIVYSDLNQYSPKHYAMSRLENSENENLKALCVAMLNYGAAAQSYFGYKTDALMNADLTDAQKALVGEYNADLFTGAVAADPAKVNGCFASTEAGFEQISASVSFEGAFALNFYFDLDRENSEVVFYYWTKEAYDSADELSDTNCTGSIAATADANGIFYAPITGIAAKELDDTVYVAATYTIDGETFCSGVIAYSLSTYCMRHANGNMGQLAQATAMYGYYAENYFGVSSQELI